MDTDDLEGVSTDVKSLTEGTEHRRGYEPPEFLVMGTAKEILREYWSQRLREYYHTSTRSG